MASSSSALSDVASDEMHASFFAGVTSALAKSYTLQTHLGRGAYGEVYSATTTPPGASAPVKVAIKKITNCFSQVTEAKRILRELRILRYLDHPNVIRIRDVLQPSDSIFQSLCVVFDYVDLDLRKLISSPQEISIAHVQWITHQLLVALAYLHSAHVLHRDLKPANVLLSETCDVKICDFGLSRVLDETEWRQPPTPTGDGAGTPDRDGAKGGDASPSPARGGGASEVPPAAKPLTRQLTTHVVTRWYRAPELILLQPYTAAIDVWSAACIFAELLTMLPEAGLKAEPNRRKALFPGRSCFPLSPQDGDGKSGVQMDQLAVIFDVLGKPPAEAMAWIDFSFIDDEHSMREELEVIGGAAPRPLQQRYPGAPAAATELLQAMLTFDPARRTGIDEALAHPFFADLPMTAQRVTAKQPVDAATVDFEHREVKLAKVRELVGSEVGEYTRRRALAAKAALQLPPGALKRKRAAGAD